MEFYFLFFFVFLLAVNVGANNAGACMATCFGSKTLTKRSSLLLVFIFFFIGSLLFGQEVIKTLSEGIVPKTLVKENNSLIFITLIIPMSAILVANIIKIPIATTHAVVASFIGIGIANNNIQKESVSLIITWWLITPVLMFIINFLIGKFVYYKIVKYLLELSGHSIKKKKFDKILRIFLILYACILALSAGANNSANAVAPLVALEINSTFEAAIIAGIAMSFGSLFFGGRIIDSMANDITDISILRAVSVQTTGGILLVIASVAGIPISLAEIITSGIIGFSCSNLGWKKTFANSNIVKILKFWVAGPIICILLSYLISLLMGNY